MKALFTAILCPILFLAACGKSDAGTQAPVQSRIVTPPSVGDMLNTIDQFKLTVVELGSVNCRPCKMMTPVLEKLSSDYAGRVQVVFFDVWQNQGPAEHYRIQSIPVQIILDPTGHELYRHVGYIPYDNLKGIIEQLLAKGAQK